MAHAENLHQAFLEELRDIYHAETQITKALPKMAKAASTDGLQQAFEAHLRETEQHVQRLEQVFNSLGEKAKAKTCEGVAGIIKEGEKVISDTRDKPTLDAWLIAAAQRVEHYEMAAYGTLVAWARAMGHHEVVNLLEQTLNEEKAADGKLTALAESGINRQAALATH